jgi:hypothetical protein
MSTENKDNIFGLEKAKFSVASYKLDIEPRVNELLELLRKEMSDTDIYFLWLSCVDYVIKDEMKINIDTTESTILYNKILEERKKLTFDCVKLLNNDEITVQE